MSIYLKKAEVTVRKNITSAIKREYRSWELPLIELKYPGSIHVQKFVWHEVTKERLEEIVGNVEKEYMRLQSYFGNDSESGTPIVQLAYGGLLDSARTLKPAMTDGIKRASVRPEDEIPEDFNGDLDSLIDGDDLLSDLGVEDEGSDVAEKTDDPINEDEAPLSMPTELTTRKAVDDAIVLLGGDPDPQDADDEAKEMLGAFVEDALISLNVEYGEDQSVEEKFHLFVGNQSATA